MNLLDFLYNSDIRLGELLSLFLQGDDDKVYIYIYNGDDTDIIFEDIRIIDPALNDYLKKKSLALKWDKHLEYISNVSRKEKKMSEYEKDCYTCKYLKVDEHEEPCRECFAFDAWEPMEKDAEKTVKEWEGRTFNV